MTKKLASALAAVWTCAALPAAAADPKLSHFAHLMAEAAVGENAPQLSEDFTAGIAAGKLQLQFERTTLEDIRAQFGGEIHSTQEATGVVSWLCYTRRGAASSRVPVTIWFISNAATPSLPLNMVVAQETDAGKHDGCTTSPPGFTLLATGLSPLGATVGDLKAHFGMLPYDKVHNVYYNSTRPLGDGTGKSVYQRLGYALKAGRAVGIAVSQSTE
ncbi:MAG: hypothetical protein P4M09_06110 [Devosia sp.]|nr:hypothetical protein [Devosia sp.]